MSDADPRARRPDSRWLINDRRPLFVLPRLAERVGVSFALVLQQLHFLLDAHELGRLRDGRLWVFMSYGEWQRREFPFWNRNSIRKLFYDLRDAELVDILAAEGRDDANGFSINYATLERVMAHDPQTAKASAKASPAEGGAPRGGAPKSRKSMVARALGAPPPAPIEHPPRAQSARAKPAPDPALGARSGRPSTETETFNPDLETNNSEPPDRAAVGRVLRGIEMGGHRFDGAALRQMLALPGVCEDAVRDALAQVAAYRGTVRNPLGLFRATLERLLGARPPKRPPPVGPEHEQEDAARDFERRAADVSYRTIDRRLVLGLSADEWARFAEQAIAEQPNEFLRGQWRTKGKDSPTLVAAVATIVRAGRVQTQEAQSA